MALSFARVGFVGVSALSLGTIFFAAPSGGPLLAGPPPAEKVKRAPDAATGGTGSVRRGSRGPSFIWVGGGYRGGK